MNDFSLSIIINKYDKDIENRIKELIELSDFSV